ncbi:MAG: hypothetical protein AAF909_14790 [Pseudomonadota bacterium]
MGSASSSRAAIAACVLAALGLARVEATPGDAPVAAGPQSGQLTLAEAPSASLEAAEATYALGEFARATAMGAALESADGFALAARSTLARAMLLGDDAPVKKIAKQAERFAEAALKLDPDHLEANLQLAVALGVRGAQMSALSAHLKGLAGRGRSHIEHALALAPDDPWAMSLMGGWHLEVVRRGGGRIYGASVEEGVRWYERALAAAPDNTVMAYRYAVALMALEPPVDTALVQGALELAMRAPPADALARALQADARRLAAPESG